MIQRGARHAHTRIALCVVCAFCMPIATPVACQSAPTGSSRVGAQQPARHNVCTQPFAQVPLNYRPPGKVLALTFDDGPQSNGMHAVLDVLQRHNATAAFFVNTYANNSWLQPFWAPQNQAALRRAVREGHEVGSHAAEHLRLSQLPPQQARAQLLWAIGNISAATGAASVPLFRAPYGDGIIGVPRAPEPGSALAQLWDTVRQHHVHVGWTFTGADYDVVASRPQGCVRRVFEAYGPPLTQQQASGVVLMHSTTNAMGLCPEGLDKLISYYKSSGYMFTSVSALVRQLYGMSPAEVVQQARRCSPPAGGVSAGSRPARAPPAAG